MGTQSQDQGGQRTQDPSGQKQSGKPGSQSQDEQDRMRNAGGQAGGQSSPQPGRTGQPGPGQERGQVAKDDGVTGEDMDDDNEPGEPGQSGNKDRERSGSTRPRNP
jgi:hypothetical protein